MLVSQYKAFNFKGGKIHNVMQKVICTIDFLIYELFNPPCLMKCTNHFLHNIVYIDFLFKDHAVTCISAFSNNTDQKFLAKRDYLYH